MSPHTHTQEKVMGISGVVEVTLNKQEVLVLYLIVQYYCCEVNSFAQSETAGWPSPLCLFSQMDLSVCVAVTEGRENSF